MKLWLVNLEGIVCYSVRKKLILYGGIALLVKCVRLAIDIVGIYI